MSKVWLIGSGEMSVEYVKVLQSLGVELTVIGRGEKSAEKFTARTGVEVVTGGLDAYIATSPISPKFAIVSVGVEQLMSTTLSLINFGIKDILTEKPAGLDAKEIAIVRKAARKHHVRLFVAYNRRFYSSVLKAKEIIAEDGGVSSFNFEFTEWSHQIKDLEKAPGVKENWFLANSSHVVDLAFYIGGKPKTISCFHAGWLEWHTRSSVFVGSGVSESGALFCYQANWAAPGRWSVEILTTKHRLVFRPMEKLQVQNIGSVALEPMLIDETLDTQYKPGLYLQVKAFLEGNDGELCSIDEQMKAAAFYKKIAGY